MRLAGKVALISGAAMGVKDELMGFGGASAWLFTQEGAKVVLGDVNEEKGEQTAAQLQEAGAEAIFVRLDVTREQDWIDAVQATVSRFGRLDILVNSAGTVAPANIEDTTLDVWNGQMDVHAKGTMLGTKHAIPEMIKAGGGSVINLSSIDGIVGSSAGTAYGAAKGAVRILTKQAAIQFAGDNIRANSVHPGYSDTPLAREGMRLWAEQERPDPRIARTPMARLASAQEIAYGILFLASDESSYVTGAELVIDGGVTAQ